MMLPIKLNDGEVILAKASNELEPAIIYDNSFHAENTFDLHLDCGRVLSGYYECSDEENVVFVGLRWADGETFNESDWDLISRNDNLVMEEGMLEQFALKYGRELFETSNAA